MRTVKKKSSRLLALLLAFLMVVTMIPATAFAAEDTAPTESVAQVSEDAEDSDETPEITSLEFFCNEEPLTLEKNTEGDSDYTVYVYDRQITDNKCYLQ